MVNKRDERRGRYCAFCRGEMLGRREVNEPMRFRLSSLRALESRRRSALQAEAFDSADTVKLHSLLRNSVRWSKTHSQK